MKSVIFGNSSRYYTFEYGKAQINGKERSLIDNKCQIAIENQIAIILLKIMRKNELINEPTYNKTLQVYLRKIKEVA